jgi:hypothetical protein
MGAQVQGFSAVYDGEIDYPATSEPGWGLPRDRPDSSSGAPGGNSNPQPSGTVGLTVSIDGEGPPTITVMKRNAIFDREVVLTVTNTGSAPLPASAIHLKLKNRAQAATLRAVEAFGDIDGTSIKVSKSAKTFLQATLPSLEPGESENITVQINETERFKVRQDTQTKIFAIEMDVTVNKAKTLDRDYQAEDTYIRP